MHFPDFDNAWTNDRKYHWVANVTTAYCLRNTSPQNPDPLSALEKVRLASLEERFDQVNWDVIKIRVNDSQLAKNPHLMNLIIRKYGRTCRRYTFEVLTNETITIVHGEFNNDYQCFYVQVN